MYTNRRCTVPTTTNPTAMNFDCQWSVISRIIRLRLAVCVRARACVYIVLVADRWKGDSDIISDDNIYAHTRVLYRRGRNLFISLINLAAFVILSRPNLFRAALPNGIIILFGQRNKTRPCVCVFMCTQTRVGTT